MPDSVTTAEYLLGFEFRYGYDEASASGLVRDHFTRVSLDAAARQFVEHHFERPLGFWLSTAHALMRRVLSDFDVNGYLGTYPLHLLSEAQWRRLVPIADKHLDVGAGNGDLTRALAPLAQSTLATEQSRAMAAVLRRRGFECLHTPAGSASELATHLGGRQFDLVTCLNVLDRTAEPLQLVSVLKSCLRPGGHLVVAVPLPLQPFYYSGSRTLPPKESLGLSGDRWETQCDELARRLGALLVPLTLRSVSRAPYISGGDRARRLYVLDDALLVFQSPPAERPKPTSQDE